MDNEKDAVLPVHEIANRFLAIGMKRAIDEMLGFSPATSTLDTSGGGNDPYAKQIASLRQCMKEQQLTGEAKRRMEAVIDAVMDQRAKTQATTLDNIAVAILSIINEYRVPLQMKR